MTFRRGAHRIARSQRRETSWLFLAATQTALVSGSSAALVSVLNAAALGLRPFTIIRSHLEALIISDQQGATESQISAVGIAIVGDQATTIGITAVPRPASDAGSDLWFLHQWMLNDFTRGSDATGFQSNAGTHYSIDSKAMRKVEDGQDLALVLENDTLSDGTAITLAGRVLIKLH